MADRYIVKRSPDPAIATEHCIWDLEAADWIRRAGSGFGGRPAARRWKSASAANAEAARLNGILLADRIEQALLAS